MELKEKSSRFWAAWTPSRRQCGREGDEKVPYPASQETEAIVLRRQIPALFENIM